MTPHTLQAATGCTSQAADRYAGPLTDAMAEWSIDTSVRQAAFIAQIAHESILFRYTREIWGPTPAQTRYEGREDLGNTEPGDGKRFCGRGLIQVTGRANYRDCAIALDVDLLAHPEHLEHPDLAARSAGWFWSAHGCNALADAGDFEALTRRINGGINGLADRLALHKRATAALIIATGKQPLQVDQPTAPIVEAGRPADPAEVAATIAERQPMPTASDIGKTLGGAISLANPFLGAAISALSGLIPEVAKLFPPGSEVAQRNVALATAVVEKVTQAVGAANAQEAVQMIAADAAVAQTAQQAVQASWFDLQEAGGGGIEGARAFTNAMAAGATPFYKHPAFVVTCLLLPLVYMTVGAVVFNVGDTWSSDIQAAVVSAVVSGVLSALVGFWFGQMFQSSARRTDATPRP